MTKMIFGIVLFLLLFQLLGYHLFSRSLLITRVMEDQEFALINHPDSIYIEFCNFGKEPSVVTTNGLSDYESLTEFEEVSQEDSFNVGVEIDTTYVLLEDEPADENFVMPTHVFKYSEIPSLSKKEQILVEKHFRRKSKYVKFTVNEGDYLNSGISRYFIYHLCLDKVFFFGNVEESLQGVDPIIGYSESWNSTYIWILFTWVKIDRHGTGIS